MESPDGLADLLHARGRKVTAQRRCILGALQGDLSHPSAVQVHQKVRRQRPDISLKTVYQTLHDLADLGVVAALDVGTGATRFDPNVETAHHHLVCRSCGKVRDLAVELPDLEVPRRAALGFAIDSAEIVFRGVCGECRSGPAHPAGAPRRRPDHSSPPPAVHDNQKG